MGMLTGIAIAQEVTAGRITIDPFDPSRINPNSYNLRLAPELKIYKYDETTGKDYHNFLFEQFTDVKTIMAYRQMGLGIALDAHKSNPTQTMQMPEDGYWLLPGILYLGSTLERTFTSYYIPMLSGRSSIGRHGMTIHVTAGFGDIGFNGRWTLEIMVAHPYKVYPGDEVCQIYFETPEGDTSYQYAGRYQNQEGTTASKFEQAKSGVFVPKQE